MAAELGFEPRMNESESLVLPLHHSASFTFARPLSQPTNDIIYELPRFVNKLTCKLNVNSDRSIRRLIPPPVALLFSDKADRTERRNERLGVGRGGILEGLAAQRADDPFRHD